MNVAIIENSGKDFFISRIRLASFLKNKGCRVIAIVPDDGFSEKIKDAGFEVYLVGKTIRGKRVLNQVKFSIDLCKILTKEYFDIVHCFRMQPNIIGGFIGGVLGLNVYNHITGLGILFTKKSLKHCLQKNLVKFCYRMNSSLFKTKCIFQNEEDVSDLGIKNNFKVIKGSAVNEGRFYPEREISNKLLIKLMDSANKNVLFVSRLLRCKGLDVLFTTIKQLNEIQGFKIKLFVVGWIDPQNTDSHSQEEIDFYNHHEFVEFLGERNDVCELITLSDICALPTRYREGTPRFLLEAMACAKPIITTDMPGCNHLIDKINPNGVLIEKNNDLGLSQGLISLLNSDLKVFGINSRRLYVKKFSERIVYNSILKFYKKE